MTNRTRLLALALGTVLALSLPAGAIGTAAAQTAGNDAVTPVLDAPDTIERGQLYELDGSASTGDIERYHWDYAPQADSPYQRSTNHSTIFAEDKTGDGQDQFSVRLGVEDSDGNVAWTSEMINVTAAEDPNASIASSDDFTVEREQTEREDSWFNSTSTDNQGIRSCEWTFEFGPTVERTSGDGLGWGDGSTECAKNYAFPVPGTYNVTLTVTDWAGNNDTTTRQVEVVPKQPVTDDPQPNAHLSAPDEIEWGSTFWMNASNSTSEDEVDYYIRESNPDNWNSDEERLGQKTYYSAKYDGQYDVIDVAVGVLTVNGQTDWDWETIDILDPEEPNAVLTGPESVAVGTEPAFDASNSTDNDRIRTYDWTVENESGHTVATETDGPTTYEHHFTEPGTYTVTVRVGDYVNHNREAPYHYGVASKTVTVSEDGDSDGGDGDTGGDGDSGDSDDGDSGDGDANDGDSGDGQDDADSPDDSDSPDNSDSPDESDPSGDESDDDQSAPSGGNGGGLPPADTDDPDATVEVEHVNESTALVEVSDASAGEDVAIDLGGNVTANAVDYEQLDVSAGANSSLSLTVTASENTPANVSAVDGQGFNVLSSLAVEGAETDDLSDATVEFRVAKDALDDADADAADVTLRRFADGEFRATDTERVNETDEAVVYRAEAGAATSYAVGVDQPALSVTDLSVAEGEHAAGDAVEVTATVANAGHAAGTMDVALAVDGETIGEQTVEVAARDSGTATFSVSVDEAGEHTVSAGDASETLSVESQETATETDDAATEATTTGEVTTPGTAFGGVSVVGVVGVLAVLAGAVLLVSRR